LAKRERIISEAERDRRQVANAIALHQGEEIPYPEVEPVYLRSISEQARLRKLNSIARAGGYALPYPELGMEIEPGRPPEKKQEVKKEEEEPQPQPIPPLRNLRDIYVDWSYLYSDYVPYNVVVRCEKESYLKAIEDFNPGGKKGFVETFCKIFRRKLDYEKSKPNLPRRISSEKEIEEVRQHLENCKANFIKNPDQYDEEDKPVKNLLELNSYEAAELEEQGIKLKKRELQYFALVTNLCAIPLDKLAAQEMGISREAITRKGGIKDRVRQKLGQEWEKDYLPNIDEYF